MKSYSVIALTLILAGCQLEPEDSGDVDCVTTNDFGEQILCDHNEARTEAVNPTPNPMLPAMTWNDDLANIAQGYAEQCKWEHNPDRSDTFNTYVGENLFAQYGSVPSSLDVVQNWMDEQQFYDYDTNGCSGVCGHYTQVVWRESTELGCAIHLCDEVEGLSWSDVYLVVCNYAPGGNYNGVRPY
jgi:uncharacterized protein YkwD